MVEGGEVEVGTFLSRLIGRHRLRHSMISTGEEGEGMSTDRIHSPRFWIPSSCRHLLLGLRLRFPCLSSMGVGRLARVRLLMDRVMGIEMTVVVVPPLHREEDNTPAPRLAGMASTMEIGVEEVEASMAPRSNMGRLAQSAAMATTQVELEVEVDRVTLREEAIMLEMQVAEEVVVVVVVVVEDHRINAAAMMPGMGMGMGGGEGTFYASNRRGVRDEREGKTRVQRSTTEKRERETQSPHYLFSFCSAQPPQSRSACFPPFPRNNTPLLLFVPGTSP
jgi:hypothetical protein